MPSSGKSTTPLSPVPYILDYSCWRIIVERAGWEPFTHFDLMAVCDFADCRQVVDWPSVRANIAR